MAYDPRSVGDQPGEDRELERKRFSFSLLFIPLFAIAGAFLFHSLSPVFSGANSTVHLARELRAEKKSGIESQTKTLVAFKESGKTEPDLFKEEQAVLIRYENGSPWAGVFLGLSFGIGMVSYSMRSKRNEYKPHQGKCYSCGRCFKYCPIKVKPLNEDQTH